MIIPDTLEQSWSVNDSRLPTEIDRALDQNYYDLVANMRKRKVLLNPISIGSLGKTWPMIAGRARLLAARQLVQEGIKQFAFIPVRVFRCKDLDEVIALRLSENTARSDNVAADYIAMRDILKATNDYKVVAEKLGIPLKDVRYMDANLSPVPEALLQGVISGKVALTTAIKVGRLKNVKTKKEIVKLFLREGKLTGADVDERRAAILKEATGNLAFM